jgi:hypothetical protein
MLMLSVVMLNVIMLSVVTLDVVASLEGPFCLLYHNTMFLTVKQNEVQGHVL